MVHKLNFRLLKPFNLRHVSFCGLRKLFKTIVLEHKVGDVD